VPEVLGQRLIVSPALGAGHPPAYLARLLTTARARRVLAGPELAHRLADADVTVLAPSEMTRTDPEATNPAGPATAGRPDADNLAYVLFTPGSAGEPKAVAITHRSLSNVVATMREMYGPWRSCSRRGLRVRAWS
jgi:non-ribosomal peptide synthetase component F